MIEIFSYSLSGVDIVSLILVAVLIGMSKTGVYGAGMITVPILALIFGGKASTGLMLPILIFADLFGVHHYHRHANWFHLRRLLPFALLGVIIGTIAGNHITDQVFKNTMAVIIFVSVAIMIWQEQNKNPKIPSSFWFVASMGILGGFTTMVGNLAGPVMALYLLAMRLPKNEYIGTAAWFFLSINVLKIPFHVFIWETITVESFLLDVMLLPTIAAGAYIGIRIVKMLPEKIFRYFIVAMTAIAALAMLVY